MTKVGVKIADASRVYVRRLRTRDFTGTKAWQIFRKSFEELFTPTWNRIAVSVGYVSSTLAVRGAVLNE